MQGKAGVDSMFKQMSFRLNDDEWKKLSNVCKTYKVSASQVLRDLINFELPKLETRYKSKDFYWDNCTEEELQKAVRQAFAKEN